MGTQVQAYSASVYSISPPGITRASVIYSTYFVLEHRVAVTGPKRGPHIAAVLTHDGHRGGGALRAQLAGGHGAQAT